LWPRSGPADQPNIQEDLSPQVPDVDLVGIMKMDLEEELIDRLLKINM